MKPKTKVLLYSVIFNICSLTFAFDWPQNLLGDDFEMYFGQIRGELLSPSLIFKNKAEIKASSTGTTAAVIGSHSQEMGWFPSTLGDAVLLGHENNLITVYANLDKDTISPLVKTENLVSEGKIIASSGNSAWQTSDSGLEFQVLDTKNKAMINPRLLLPRLQSEKPYYIGQVTIDDKNKNSYNLSSVKALYAGQYSLYREKDTLNIPYKITITINGELKHTVQFDSLSVSDKHITVGGNSYLNSLNMYPDSKRQLIGSVNLMRGRNLITITLTNILGETKTASYAIDVN